MKRAIAAEANQTAGESAGKSIGLPRHSGTDLGKYGSERLLWVLLRVNAAECILGYGALPQNLILDNYSLLSRSQVFPWLAHGYP